MSERVFVIDCDTGTDDAIAILAALYCKDIKVAAITSVNGNAPHKNTSANNLNLIEYLGADVPVAKGAVTPLYPRGDYYGAVHGAAGFGNVVIPAAKEKQFAADHAAELIRKEAERQNGNLELLVIGPMTNIAIAFSLYPEIKSKIKHIWAMGGAVKGGNKTPSAEFNIWVDPMAAKLVIDAGVPMTMVGLDVTEQAVLNTEDAKAIRGIGSKAAVLAADLLDFMFERCREGGEDAIMHDALALAAAVCPECLTCRDCFADVEWVGAYTAGHTMVDVEGNLGRCPNVSVAMELDLAKFKAWLIGCFENSRKV